MPELTLRKIELGFGGPNLLEDVDFGIERGEKVCLIGRNGAGKSTLMKVISGELPPDKGEVAAPPDFRVARLAQELPEGIQGKVFDVVASGLGALSELVSGYHRLSASLHEGVADRRLAALDRIQQELEAAGGWQVEQRVETVISRLSLPADTEFSELSGGLQRRVLLAAALVKEPDLLLLDEPTNHLDIEAIGWLEQFLAAYKGALLFVTHDRVFLQRLATRIVELDRGRLIDWLGDFASYQRRKEEALQVEARDNRLFDKKLASEERWVRQGIRARRTRNEGRVRALKALREERRRRRDLEGTVNLSVQAAEKSGRLVVIAEHVNYAWADRPVVRDFSIRILRGDKIGVIGPNGAGKTTLLHLLLGRLPPDSGRILTGSRVEVAYSDQLRAQLDEEKSVRDNVAGGSDRVVVNGQAKHVIGYLQDFLFSPERANSPVRALSGGERNRLMLARLFTKPANVLVLDEPTNDLDVETLELLEQRLVDYEGTLLLVSHDRAFLDNIVTSTLVFEGDGRIAEYVGGYDDWLRQRPSSEATGSPVSKKAASREPAAPRRDSGSGKLSYKDRRELEALPGLIEELEAQQERLQRQMQDPVFYQGEKRLITEVKGQLDQVHEELEQAYRRWERLESVS